MKVKPVNIKNILYTTDLSDTSLHAFSYAVSLANCYGAAITILHVLDERNSFENFLPGILEEEKIKAIQERKQEEINAAREALIGKSRENIIAEEALSQFAQDVQADPETSSFNMDEVVVLRGDPSEKILEVAQEKNTDLIVMGSHGHGLLSDLGSTARKVTRQSEIPVLSVRLQK